jgi:hypothetical protein
MSLPKTINSAGVPAKLIAEINAMNAEGQGLFKKGVQKMHGCGKRLALAFDLVAKSNCDWKDWLAANCPPTKDSPGISERLARHYRNLYTAVTELPNGELLLNDGVAACHILREWHQMKQIESNAEGRDHSLERKKRDAALYFSYDECTDQIDALLKTDQIFELSETSQKQLLKKLDSARKKIEESLKNKSAIDIEEFNKSI